MNSPISKLTIRDDARPISIPDLTSRNLRLQTSAVEIRKQSTRPNKFNRRYIT